MGTAFPPLYGFTPVRAVRGGIRYSGLLDHKIGDRIYLPERVALRKVAESAAKRGVQVMDRRGVVGRRPDEPITGEGAVFPRDDREAKYGRPGIYYNFRGPKAQMIMGDGRPLEALQDEARENNHYGTWDKGREAERPPQDPNAWMAAFLMIEEIKRNRAAGRKVYGALPQGRSR